MDKVCAFSMLYPYCAAKLRLIFNACQGCVQLALWWKKKNHTNLL